MITIVRRANERGEFSQCGTDNNWLFQDIKTPLGAIERAILYASGRAYRVEMYREEQFYSGAPPFRIIEQKARSVTTSSGNSLKARIAQQVREFEAWQIRALNGPHRKHLSSRTAQQDFLST
jgi:hypothetical protein